MPQAPHPCFVPIGQIQRAPERVLVHPAVTRIRVAPDEVHIQLSEVGRSKDFRPDDVGVDIGNMLLKLLDNPIGVPIANVGCPTPRVVNFARKITPDFPGDFL